MYATGPQKNKAALQLLAVAIGIISLLWLFPVLWVMVPNF